MRPADYSPEQIIQAGQELQAAGRNITGFALRQKVGGGNPTRLKQVWDEHVSSSAAGVAEPVAELPVEVAEEVAAVTKELTDRLAALAVGLNDKAVKAAERRVAEVVRTAGEQREQAERELADAAETVDDLETRLDEATGRIAVLETTLFEANAANRVQAVELAQLRERLAAAEQQTTDLRTQVVDQADKYRVLTDSHHKLQGDLLVANAATARENEFRCRAEKDLHEVNDRLAAVQSHHEAQAVELGQVKERLAEAERQEQAAAERHAVALTELRNQLAAAAKSSQERGDELVQVRERLAAAEQQATDLRGQLAGVTTTAAAQGDELFRLRESIQQLTGELGRATGECEALRRQAGEQTKTIAAFATKETSKRGKKPGEE